MNVVSLAILPVSAECGEVLEDEGVAALLLDIAGAQVTVEVLVVVVHPDVAACHPELAATAGHQFVDEMKCHLRMEMEPGPKDVEAGADLGRLNKNFRYILKCLELCVYYAWI